MSATDLGPVAAMIALGGWGDRRPLLEWAVAHAAADPVVAERDGSIVGSGVGTLNGPVGWLGVIFVDRRQRRRGYGRALTEAICERLETAGARTLTLTASRQGAPLYDRLGFRETDRYVTFEIPGGNERHGTNRGPVGVRQFREDDRARVEALDREATGEDRSHLLRAWADRDSATVAVDPSGRVRGFIVRPPWGGGATIADAAETALALLDQRRLRAGPGRTVRAGVPGANVAGREMLAATGWQEAWSAPRMERGEPIDWRPERIFGQFGMAFG
ncbi:MAG TPA: GNAT family N-acetyltransferase [Candidatus Limnocylindrales bacterium]|nr:GNAT family N-acetyltransferase [Candidatus Limnocylindrales bacterium]